MLHCKVCTYILQHVQVGSPSYGNSLTRFFLILVPFYLASFWDQNHLRFISTSCELSTNTQPTNEEGGKAKWKMRKEDSTQARKHASMNFGIITMLFMYQKVLTRYSPKNLVGWLQVHLIEFHTCILKGLITAHEIKLEK